MSPSRSPRQAQLRARTWLDAATLAEPLPPVAPPDRAGIDFTADPVDPALSAGLDHRALAAARWMPWRRLPDGTLVVIAGTRLDPGRRAAIARELGERRIEAIRIEDRRFESEYERTFRAALVYDAADRLADEHPDESAYRALTRWQWWLPIGAVAAAVGAFAIWPYATFTIVFLGANAVFLINIVFKTFASVRAPWRILRRASLGADVSLERMQRGLGAEWPGPIRDEDLPVYTILVPAFHEANVIGKLVRNLEALDYPREKLDVLLLLEEDDAETIAAAHAAEPPEYIRIVTVPRGTPQTKPRACNYGLAIARGEFLVIYDAEDRPDPDQLRIAVQAFRANDFTRAHLDPEAKPVQVLQASLNYFNADYNVLTRLFANEYSFWFDGMIPGLDDLGIPIPLGGTSNHFRIEALRAVGGWDPYNVTEDADLGIRIATHGGKVGVIDSTTWEEACAETFAWIRQRTRWIKGYMVTSAVNTRHPIRWVTRNGPGAAVTLFALILSTPLAFLAYPVILAFTVVTYIGITFAELDIPDWIYQIGLANMLIGNALMIAAAAAAAWRRYGWRIAAFSVLNPVYWFLHSAAAWRAAWQMYFAPHKWEKTPHGLSEDYESGVVTTRP